MRPSNLIRGELIEAVLVGSLKSFLNRPSSPDSFHFRIAVYLSQYRPFPSLYFVVLHISRTCVIVVFQSPTPAHFRFSVTSLRYCFPLRFRFLLQYYFRHPIYKKSHYASQLSDSLGTDKSCSSWFFQKFPYSAIFSCQFPLSHRHISFCVPFVPNPLFSIFHLLASIVGLLTPYFQVYGQMLCFNRSL